MLDKMKIFIVTLALVCVAAGQNSSESTSVVASSTEGPTTSLVSTARQTTGSIKDKTTVEDKTTKPDTTTANLDTTIVTTLTPITTAPIPPGWETTNNYTYAPKKNGTVCLMAVFSAHFKQEDNTWNVSKDAAIVHDDSGCGRLSVNFGKNNFVLSFNQTSKGAFYLSEVNATISKTDKEIRPSAGGLTMAKTSNGSSYMCLSGLTIDLSENVTFYMKQVQFQVYYVKDAKFATAQKCESDLSPLVPIIVGAVLAGLVIIVVVAYFIGRNRNRVGYEEI